LRETTRSVKSGIRSQPNYATASGKRPFAEVPSKNNSPMLEYNAKLKAQQREQKEKKATRGG
jgi:hypothetical protein